MKNIVKLTIATSIVASLSSCIDPIDLLDSTDNGGSGNPVSGNSVIANVNKGPVNGATCNLLKADGSTLTASVKSVAGKATFTNVPAYSDVMRAECSGGTYTDELDKSTKTLGNLKGATSRIDNTNQIITLSPITTAAYKKLDTAGSFGDVNAVITANKDIADELGLDGIDILAVLPTDISGGAVAGSDAAGKYALAITAMLQAVVNDTNTFSIDSYIDDMAVDFADGTLGTATTGAISKGMTDYINSAPTDSFPADVLEQIKKDIAANLGEDGAIESDGATPTLLKPDLNSFPALSNAGGLKDTAFSWIPMNVGGKVTTWSISSGSLQSGLNINSTTGEISGTPVGSGTDNISVLATNATGTDSFNLVITISADAASVPAPVIANAADVSYSAGSFITPIEFATTGGQITSCSETTSLLSALGLVVGSITDGSKCVITGKINSTAAASANAITIKATNGGGNDTASVNITVNAALAAPILANGTDQVATNGSAITAITFANTGGAMTSCTVAPALPTGLSINNTTCEITGTPSANQVLTAHTITGTNASGNDTASVNITVNAALAAPILANGTDQVATNGSAITAITFANTGGAMTSCTVAPALPTGLSINNTTCEITGTPSANQVLTAHTITGTNASGNDTASVNITVNAALAAPILANGTDQVATNGSAITAITFANTGGAMTSCTVAPALPTGLSINNTTCEITGTPSANQVLTAHTITGTNASGNDTASVNITVNAALAAPILANGTDQVATNGSAITAITFANTGGAMTSCTVAPALPTGLSINNTTCEITGTPSANQVLTAHTITGTNASGNDTATVNITVNSANVTKNSTPETSANGSTISFNVDGALSGSCDASDFALTASNALTAPTISSVACSGTTVVLTMSPNLASASAGATSESINIAFTKSASSVNLNNFTAVAITNSVTTDNCDVCRLDSADCPF
jgi:hypothetical protein